MKKSPYILALDCGTTGNRAMAVDAQGRIATSSYAEFTQYYPKPGWVEHDAEEIWQATLKAARTVVKSMRGRKLQGIGITNQRETLVVWDKQTGKPAHKAIVWQCRRTADLCAKLKRQGREKSIHTKTGLFLDPYFTGTKILWLTREFPKIKAGLQSGKLICGTIDTWIAWKLTSGKTFVTDPTNASRTLLYNLRTHRWDPELCKLMGVPMKALAKVVPSCGVSGTIDARWFGTAAPLAGIAGDQQSAAFAQGCSPEGIVKNTYGTGLFVVADTGSRIVLSDKLITTVAATDTKKPRYALEGSVFIGGAAIQWLRDGLKIITSAAETEAMTRSLASNDGVYFVPALAGLGCPYWDPKARGLIIGLTRSTRREHLVRACLESLAYQTRDVLELVRKESKLPVKRLRVDGGAVRNDFLMQFQADIAGCEVERPKLNETTALGAAALAGIATGMWRNAAAFLRNRKVDKVFHPRMKSSEREKLYTAWRRAAQRSLDWA